MELVLVVSVFRTKQYWKARTSEGTHRALANMFGAALDPYVLDFGAISVDRHGTSAGNATASIQFDNYDGEVKRFFIRYAVGDHGKAQLEGGS